MTTMSARPSHAPAPAAPTAVPARTHLLGLDGLRAVAIIAVVLFHLNPSWLPGGFLGVDIFFVISGFLITTLLVREHARSGTIDLRSFWARRAARLLPALLLCVPVSVLLARITEADLLVGIGRQVLGSLTFSYNWLQIAAGADYFNSTTPQLFMNLWSLAVEEQFYLLWPLATWLLVRHVGNTWARVAGALGLGAASALGMAVLLEPAAGATRVYYGTDTHLFGLMLGAALAFWYAGPGAASLAGPAFAARRPALVAGAALTLGALLWWLDESRSVTFRGGLLLASAATAVLIVCAVSGGGFGRALEFPALRWIGARSYGIYLWHWPVILIVDAGQRVVSGSEGYLGNRLWCVVVTLALADLSYRFVETPIRRRGWRGSASALDAWAVRTFRRPATPWAAGLIATLAVATLAITVTAPAQTSTQRLIEANAKEATRAATPTAAASGPAKPDGPSIKDAGFTMPTGKEVDAYGDSMLVGSVPAMKYYFSGIRIDAKSNRRWSAGLAAVRASGHDVRRAVVLVFGTNAGVVEADVRKTMDRLGPHRMVVLVNIHLNASRTAKDNRILAEVAKDYPNAIVADWAAAVAKDRGALQPDGIHPSMTGQHTFAAVIRQSLADLSYAHTGVRVKLKKLPIP